MLSDFYSKKRKKFRHTKMHRNILSRLLYEVGLYQYGLKSSAVNRFMIYSHETKLVNCINRFAKGFPSSAKSPTPFTTIKGISLNAPTKSLDLRLVIVRFLLIDSVNREKLTGPIRVCSHGRLQLTWLLPPLYFSYTVAIRPVQQLSANF